MLQGKVPHATKQPAKDPMPQLRPGTAKLNKKKVDRKQEKEMEKELSAQEQRQPDTVAHGATSRDLQGYVRYSRESNKRK